MSTTINWKTTPDKEKIRLIIEHVMQWVYYETWITFHKPRKDIYPVAFRENQPYGHSCWSVLYEPGQDARVFDPLHRMDDAWLIVDCFDVIDLLRIEKSSYRVNLCKGNLSAQGVAETAQEAICLAALKAVGCTITD